MFGDEQVLMTFIFEKESLSARFGLSANVEKCLCMRNCLANAAAADT